jgi:mono/diheme cytochrome c family protein
MTWNRSNFTRLLVPFAAFFLIVVAAGCGGTTTADVDRGRTLFIEKCGACHALAQAGTSSTVGPDLDAAFAAARAAGMDGETIKGVVIPQVEHPRPSTDNPTVSMPANIVTGRDLEDVAAYVGRYAGVPGAAPPKVKGGPGAQVFADFGCGGCHVLAAAGSTGTTGPDLDKVLAGVSPDKIHEDIVDPESIIAPGYPSGVMPSNFGDQMTEQQLKDLIDYLVESTSGGGNG